MTCFKKRKDFFDVTCDKPAKVGEIMTVYVYKMVVKELSMFVGVVALSYQHCCGVDNWVPQLLQTWSECFD